MKLFKIYTRKMAYQLRLANFAIVRTEPNPKQPQFDIYLFKDTPEFRETLTRLSSK